MKIKTQDLTGPALDWAVAKIETLSKSGVGLIIVLRDGRWLDHDRHLYSTHWAKGGPIIEREKINPEWMHHSGCWMANCLADRNPYEGPTPLIAAMRCYVASKLGGEVDIPEELV